MDKIIVIAKHQNQKNIKKYQKYVLKIKSGLIKVLVVFNLMNVHLSSTNSICNDYLYFKKF